MLARLHPYNARKHTSVILSELNLLLEFKLISVHFCIKAIILLEYTCQGSYPSVDSTPVRNALARLNLWYDIFEVLLSE